MRRFFAVIFLGAACATVNKGDIDSLKPTLEAFHSKMRWKDLRAIPDQLMPDRRDAFTKASERRDDDKNLNVTDYQLETCKILDDLITALCYSHISWYRLPSINEKTVSVTTTLKWKGGAWLVERQSDGPFAEELSVGKP